MNTSAPSTTITAAGLAGLGATLLVEIAMQLGADLRPTLAGAFVAFASALVGYLTPERRYGWGENE